MVKAPAQIHVVEADQWATITQHARTNMHPAHWPDGVLMLSLEGNSFLGMDDQGNLYVNGDRLYTARRLGRQERLLAWIIAVTAIVGAIAACLSAYADMMQVGK